MKTIPLTKGQFALVDDSDFEWLSQWKWCCDHPERGLSEAYATRRVTVGGKRRLLYMHRVILGVASGEVDHRDRNGLNNQRHNLRPCTNSQNQMNKPTRRFDRYKGVHFSRLIKRWVAYISKDHKTIHLGCFDYSTDAAIAYNNKAKELHGEFACLNQIPE